MYRNVYLYTLSRRDTMVISILISVAMRMDGRGVTFHRVYIIKQI